MKRLRILGEVLKRTGATKILAAYVVFFFLEALLVMLVEPEIHKYGDALWYLYAVASTAGFGDFIAMTLFGRILSVLLSIYTILVVSLVTGVIVSFYNEVSSMRYKASKAEIIDQLEHLEELSKEELAELSQKIKNMPKV